MGHRDRQIKIQMLASAFLGFTARPQIDRVDAARAISSHVSMKVLQTYSDSQFPPEWPFTSEDMLRLDESPDFNFYSAPRFVTHIDDGAIAAITQYYRESLT